MGNSVVLRGATVVDGTGRPTFRADVAISDGVITEVGDKLNQNDGRAIDVGDLIVAPGFIDSHTHTDGTAFAFPLCESKLFQGVSSEVTGNCGIGFFPVDRRHQELLQGYLGIHDFAMPAEIAWADFEGYVRRLTKTELGVNHIPLVAHGALRIAVMGAEDREASQAEQQEMNRLLATSLKQGAWGISTGLIYPPGSFATTSELISLARISAEHGSVYASHIRGESATLMDAVDEAIEIGRKSQARVIISHLKPLGRDNWGKGETLLKIIESARAEGVDVTADQYPYEASSTSLTALVPARFHAGGINALLASLSDQDKKQTLATGIEHEMNVRGGPEKVMVTSIATAGNAGLSGKTLAQIALMWAISPVDVVIRLLKAERGAVGAVYFSISEQDVDAIMRSANVGIGSDGRGLRAGASNEATHPRSYGTFPRVLGKYVREKKLLPMETAVYKMTRLTAQRFGIKDRGAIAAGMVADVVVFDPATIRDIADFGNPHQYSEGIVYLFINGVEIISKGKLTGNVAGRVLLHN